MYQDFQVQSHGLFQQGARGYKTGDPSNSKEEAKAVDSKEYTHWLGLDDEQFIVTYSSYTIYQLSTILSTDVSKVKL